MTDPSIDRFRREFKALGVKRVRNELMLRRWPKDKLSEARLWVERQDVGDWMAAKGDRPVRARKDRKKWIAYAVVAFGLIFVGIRLLRMLGG